MTIPREQLRQRIGRARKAVRTAEAKLHKVLTEAYPKGTNIYYDHGNYSVLAIVIWDEPTADGRLKVLGAYSGKEYFIDAFRVTQVAA